MSPQADLLPLRSRNHLLDAIPRDAFAHLVPDLERVEFAAGMRLYSAFEPITGIHFVESGLLSCFAGERGRDQTEIALIGREGLAGLPLVMGADTSPFTVVAQRAGEAYRLRAARLPAALDGHLRDVLLRYAYAMSVQIAETGRANARQTVEARLARWLLMAHDRIDGAELELTHENLSMILGVRRPGITVALHVLEGEHMVRARRGVIEIVDRAKLEAAANGSYGLGEAEYARVLGLPAVAGPRLAVIAEAAPPLARPVPGAA